MRKHIKRIIKRIIVISVFILIGGMSTVITDGYFFNAQNILPEPASYPVTKHIKYRFSLHNKSNERLNNQLFRVYAPVKETASQKVIEIKASQKYTLITDKYKNQILVFHFAELAPYSSKQISIQVQLNMAKIPNYQTLSISEDYLQSTPYVELDAPQVQQLSAIIKQKSDAQSALKAYQWSVNNIRYNGYRAEQMSASETLKRRVGDCTEFMHVVTAINRSNQIATREVAGYIVSQSRILKSNEYHNWAESYLDGRWLLSDPQNKKHQRDHQDYIAFRHYGNDPLNPLQDVHRYKVSDPRLRVVMN